MMTPATHGSSAPPSDTGPASTAGPTVVRVLLVADDEDDRELTRGLLDEISDGRRYELTSTADYDEALAALVRAQYDVCLLDQLLGRWKGVDLLTEATNAGARVPIIFLTGRGTAGIERRVLADGATDYLVKGDINVAVLERSIRHSLERARALDALRAREHQFRSVFESANDAMIIADDAGRYLDGNAAALALFGVTRERLLAMQACDVAPDRRAETSAAWEAFMRNGSAEGEMLIRRADGTERLVEFRAQTAITPGRHLSILRDVTERHAAEEQRVRLAAIVESAGDAIETVTLDGIIEYWSPSAERLYGYSAEEVLGRPKTILIPEQSHDEFKELLERVRGGGAVRDREMLRRRKDGIIFVAAVTISPVYLKGRLVAFSTIVRDVSEKKKLEAHLALSDRMASVGALAAGVAHEINNPLAVVIANLELVAPSLGTSGEELEALTDAQEAANRIRHVVRDLRLFSRPDEERRGAVEVHQLIDSSARMAWNEIRHRAKLVKHYGDIPLVDGSEARLGQVLLNLLVNAAQAIPEGNARGNEIRIVTRTNRRRRVVVEVIDTGDGIATDHLARLFEPFFTTKPAGVGTGLGLSICKRIIEDMNGTIAVESVVGQGTTFRLELPPASKDSRVVDSAPPTARLHSRRGRVLVIDDDPLITKVVTRLLFRHHDVVGAAAAAEALREVKGGRFDAILCDMMMPQMSGMEFFEALRLVRPEYASRVAFVTGGAFTPGARDFLARVENRVIDKPFDAARLVAVVDEVMVEVERQKARKD